MTDLIALAKQANGITTSLGTWFFSPESLQAFGDLIAKEAKSGMYDAAQYQQLHEVAHIRRQENTLLRVKLGELGERDFCVAVRARINSEFCQGSSAVEPSLAGSVVGSTPTSDNLILAVLKEREACAVECALNAPKSCSGIEVVLWDVATDACAASIRARTTR